MYQKGKDKRHLGKVINDFHHQRCCKMLEDHQGTVLYGNAQAYEDKDL